MPSMQQAESEAKKKKAKEDYFVEQLSEEIVLHMIHVLQDHAVKMKDNTEVFVLRNCCIQAHSVSLNADGTTEETLEFMTYLDPIIGSAVSVADAGAF